MITFFFHLKMVENVCLGFHVRFLHVPMWPELDLNTHQMVEKTANPITHWSTLWVIRNHLLVGHKGIYLIKHLEMCGRREKDFFLFFHYLAFSSIFQCYTTLNCLKQCAFFLFLFFCCLMLPVHWQSICIHICIFVILNWVSLSILC